MPQPAQLLRKRLGLRFGIARDLTQRPCVALSVARRWKRRAVETTPGECPPCTILGVIVTAAQMVMVTVEFLTLLLVCVAMMERLRELECVSHRNYPYGVSGGVDISV